ncbi:hypothetical protein D6C98_09106 [Aureobasidium pullulans]|uniref:BTB domain-containing protein n=2 Tax=Aureobasidium pullulans TaxID=5580 RepID=A0A4S9PTK6_AURPU|nr:hypothetical protein D6D12_09782 [Aureobasidium pullulans]THX45315.1 hypothetical protein D6D11_07478 [Aureobasidium pullulans]THY41851.1 hypothetical protein D6C98_09106 [Aureobasidium pullulans]THY73847.1 hypothetical protein D6C94_05386 [Aureobasidium pullulans]THY82138.1 hypothetical protein D6C93_09313 [Aureobasidium pullulans]
MGSWSERLYQHAYRYLPPIYSRDFAYANNAPVVLRMARANVSEITAKTFAELLSGPTIDFYVGEERRHWSLHRNLLCHHSPYFESEFLDTAPPKASKRSELDLPDQDPAGFELLVKWLYQGTLDDTSDMTDEKKYDYSVACHKLYLLCNKFDIPNLKNESIDRYRQGLLEAQLVPDADEINDIYRSSPTGSPFRKLMAQIAARQIMDPDSDKNAESYRNCFKDNPDFAVDMVNAIKEGTGGILFDDPTDGDEDAYHEDTTPRLNSKGKGPASMLTPTSPRRPTSPSAASGAERRRDSGQSSERESGPPTPPDSARRNNGYGVRRFNGTSRTIAKSPITGERVEPHNVNGDAESPSRKKPKKLVIRGGPPSPKR